MTAKATATDRPGGERASSVSALRLCRAAQNGSADVLDRLIRGEQDVWYRTALALLHDEHGARDAAQETALRFVRGLPGFAGDSSLRTWGIGIAVNVCREMRRRGAKRVGTVADARQMEADEPSPGFGLEQEEQVTRLRHHVRALPDRQREAVVLRYFEQLGVADTAAAMGCAEGTVKATLSQALTNLRQRMGETP